MRQLWKLLGQTVLGLICCAGVCHGELQGVSLPGVRASHPCVYVDRSHDWKFAYDDLADRMLVPSGFDVVLSDASLTAVAPLSRFAVVVVQQCFWQAPLSDQETKVLSDYVERGGRLLIVTKKGLPAENLAAGFGFRLTQGGRAPLHALEPLVQSGSPHNVPTIAVRCRLSRSPQETVLIEDGDSNPVVAARDVGLGEVVLWADDGIYWDFCAQRDRGTMAVASSPTTTALFKWLAGRNAATAGRACRVFAENVERHGALEFRYSNPSAAAAREIMKHVPAVMKVVEKWNGNGPPTEPPFTIHWLCAGGGGWAGPHGAGVCVYGVDPAYPIKVMAHELTHSSTGPLPRAFGEAWAVVVGARAAEAHGYPASASAELRGIIARLDKVDGNRTALDMMDSNHGPMNHDYQIKATWMLLELEKKYGPDFIARFLAMRNQKHGLRKHINLEQTFELFAEASGDPGIWDWFRSCGTSVRRSRN